MPSSPASLQQSALLVSRPSTAVAPPSGFIPGHGSAALVAQQQTPCFLFFTSLSALVFGCAAFPVR
jgi:hypothetical protein